MQRQPSDFDDMEFPTFNSVADFVFDDDFDNMFAAEYKSFHIDDEPKHDVFKFDDVCSSTNCVLTNAFESASESIALAVALELNLFLTLLRAHF